MCNIVGVLLEAGTVYPSRAPKFTAGFLVGSVLLKFFIFSVVLLCVFSFLVLCCAVCLKTMFGMSLHPICLWEGSCCVCLGIVSSEKHWLHR